MRGDTLLPTLIAMCGAAMLTWAIIAGLAESAAPDERAPFFPPIPHRSAP